MPRERSAGRKPRQIAVNLARLAREQRTPRTGDLVEAGPETNDPGGSMVAVESTRTSPGAGGVAVVTVPAEIAEHTDDDARIVVGEDGEPEIVEPPALEQRSVPRGVDPDGDGSLTGEANTSDPRDDADDDDRKAVEGNADPGAEGSPARQGAARPATDGGAGKTPGGESMTTERVEQVRQAPRKGTARP